MYLPSCQLPSCSRVRSQHGTARAGAGGRRQINSIGNNSGRSWLRQFHLSIILTYVYISHRLHCLTLTPFLLSLIQPLHATYVHAKPHKKKRVPQQPSFDSHCTQPKGRMSTDKKQRVTLFEGKNPGANGPVAERSSFPGHQISHAN